MFPGLTVRPGPSPSVPFFSKYTAIAHGAFGANPIFQPNATARSACRLSEEPVKMFASGGWAKRDYRGAGRKTQTPVISPGSLKWAS